MLFTMAICLYHQDIAQIKSLSMLNRQIISLKTDNQFGKVS